MNNSNLQKENVAYYYDAGNRGEHIWCNDSYIIMWPPIFEREADVIIHSFIKRPHRIQLDDLLLKQLVTEVSKEFFLIKLKQALEIIQRNANISLEPIP